MQAALYEFVGERSVFYFRDLNTWKFCNIVVLSKRGRRMLGAIFLQNRFNFKRDFQGNVSKSKIFCKCTIQYPVQWIHVQLCTSLGH